MADTKISAATNNATVADTDEFATNKAGASQRTSASALKTYTNTAPVFAAGTASANTWPKLTSGTLLTTPEAGALEYDGVVQYATPGGTAGRGVLPVIVFTSAQADFTLSASAGAQNCFAVPSDTLTVAGSTTYWMQGLLILNTGTTTHTTALGFALAGGASVTSFEYQAMLWSAAANTIATTQSTTHVSGVASKVLNATSTAVYTIIQFEGLVRFNAGGTIAPQINFSANPTGTNLTKVGSYVMFTPMGTNTVTAVGPWA